jgi:hypothetical protein
VLPLHHKGILRWQQQGGDDIGQEEEDTRDDQHNVAIRSQQGRGLVPGASKVQFCCHFALSLRMALDNRLRYRHAIAKP